MSKTLLLIAGAIVLAGCASNSTQTTGAIDKPTGDATETVVAEKPKMRCRRVQSTESPRLGKRVCTPIVE